MGYRSDSIAVSRDMGPLRSKALAREMLMNSRDGWSCEGGRRQLKFCTSSGDWIVRCCSYQGRKKSLFPVRMGHKEGHHLTSGRKTVYTTTTVEVEPSFFLFRVWGSMVYTLLSGPIGVYPFPLFSQENGMHHSFFCSVTFGVGRQTEKRGVPRWCLLFFPLLIGAEIWEGD